MADSAQISNKLRPPCTKCGKPLLLTRREPEKPGFARCVYYCASCGASDRAIATFWTGAAPDLGSSQFPDGARLARIGTAEIGHSTSLVLRSALIKTSIVNS